MSAMRLAVSPQVPDEVQIQEEGPQKSSVQARLSREGVAPSVLWAGGRDIVLVCLAPSWACRKQIHI